MTPNEAQQFICGSVMMLVTMVFLIGGFKLLHGPDYRKDRPLDEE
ncbi:MAG: hypothetical protein SF029_05735 [bacterium]|nr:hypothetical protein [bacterium]